MSLSVTAIAALNQWSGQESAFLPAYTQAQGVFGTVNTPIALGTLFNNGLILADSIRNGYESFSLQSQVPVPAAGATTASIPLFIPAVAGTRATVQFMIGSLLGSTTTNTQPTSLQIRRINLNNTSSFGYPVSLGSGLTAGVSLIIPTGSKNSLLSANVQYSVTASGLNVTFNVSGGVANSGWIYTPAVGDYVVIDPYNTSFTGNGYNQGCYTVGAATSTYIYMTKQSVYSTTCSNVASVTAVAADIAGIVTVAQTGASFSAGDMLALQVVVPVGNVTSVQNLNNTASLLQLTLKPGTF